LLKSPKFLRQSPQLGEWLGFVHISARPRHPGQDAEIVEAFKKTFREP
jgi:hypothetical protein